MKFHQELAIHHAEVFGVGDFQQPVDVLDDGFLEIVQALLLLAQRGLLAHLLGQAGGTFEPAALGLVILVIRLLEFEEERPLGFAIDQIANLLAQRFHFVGYLLVGDEQKSAVAQSLAAGKLLGLVQVFFDGVEADAFQDVLG